MELFDAIYGRKCYRNYLDKPVEDEKIEQIVKAAARAPSAGNLQPWDFIITREKELKEQIMRIARNQKFILEAPVLITVCTNLKQSASVYGKRGRELYALQDSAAAMQNILLAVYALGLGACWIGEFDEEKLRKILKIPSFIRPVSIISIGYPSEEVKDPEMDDWRSFTHEETF
ncbi:MAG: nitroreductase family protein [Planctomycetes bacterium]|nr:nitroreductase family protein [Planctomycetota bacterium]